MAKDKLTHFDDTAELWDDMDDFNYDPSKTSVKNDRNPTMATARTAGRAMKDTMLTRQFAGKMIRGALPEEYGKTADKIDDVLWHARDIKKVIANEARPAIQAGKETLRTLNRLIPSPLQDKIEKALSKSKSSSGMPDYDLEDAAVGAQMQGIWEERVAEERQEKAERFADRLTEIQFRQKLFEQLVGIRRTGERDYSYRTEVTRKFQQKQLELQIRHLIVSRNQLEVSTKFSTEATELLKGIQKNSGLPDVMKERNSETLKRLLREQLMGKAQKHISEFSRDYFKGVAKNIGDIVRRNVDNFKMGLETIGDSARGIEDAQKMNEEFGGTKRDFWTELLAGELANKLGSKAANQIRKRNPFNGKLKDLFSRTQYMANNAEYLLNDWGQKAENESPFGLKGLIGRIFNVGHRKENMVREGGMGFIDSQTDTNVRKLRAIEVIIPGYLSKILQEVKQARTGKPEDREIYDTIKGQWRNYGDTLNDVKRLTLSEKDVEAQGEKIHELIDRLDPSGKKISVADRTALYKHLIKKSGDPSAFSPEMLLRSDIPGMSPSGMMRLEGIIASRYGYSRHRNRDGKTDWRRLKANMMAPGGAALRDDADIFNQARNYSVDIYNRAHTLYQSGYGDQLLELGILKRDGDNIILNDDYHGSVIQGIRSKKEKEEAARIQKKIDSYQLRKKRRKGSKKSKGRNDRIKELLGGYKNLSLKGNTDDFIVPKDDTTGRSWLGTGEGNLISAIDQQTEILRNAIEAQKGREELASILEQVILVNEQIANGITYNPGEGGTGTPRRGFFRRLGSGIQWGGRKAWGLGKSAAMAPWHMAQRAYRVGRWATRRPLRALKNKLFSAKDKVNVWLSDAYVKGSNGLRRAIDSAGLEAGRYKDVLTGKIIKSLKDITGPVMDIFDDKLVITQEEYDNGLLNSLGKRIKESGIFGRAKNLTSNLFSIATSPLRFAKDTAKRIGRGVTNFVLSPPDIYVGGEPTPRLLSVHFRSGMYYSAMTGKQLRYFGDIDGDVAIIDSETRSKKIILSAAEIAEKGLFDANGQPIKGVFGKIKAFLGKMWGKVKTAAGWLNPLKVLRKGKELLSKGWDKTKGVAKGIFGKPTIQRKFGMQVVYLRKIHALLVAKFTGNKLPREALMDETIEGAKGIIGNIRDRFANLRQRFSNKKDELEEGLKQQGGWRGFRDNLRGKFKDRKDQIKAKIDAKVEELEIKAKAESKWEKIKQSKLGAAALSFKDKLKTREGSWLNRQLSKASGGIGKGIGAAKENVKEHGLWKGLMLSAVMAVPAALKMIWKKITGGFGVVKDVIQSAIEWFAKKRAMDTVGDALGGDGDFDYDRNGRKRRKGSRSRARRMRRAGRSGGRGRFGRLKSLFRGGARNAGANVGKRGLVRGGLRLAGRAALSIGRGALWASRALMFSPWGLGIAAGAAVIYGGYKLFKYFKNAMDDFQTLRMMGYGWNNTDHGRNEKILNVEGIVAKSAKYQDGKVTFSNIDHKSIIEAMDIDMSAPEQRVGMAKWFDERFTPVFKQCFKAMKELDPKADITDIKGTLPDHFKAEWAKRSRIPGDQNGNAIAYFKGVSPFADDMLMTGTEFIDSQIAKIVKQYEAIGKKYAETKAKAMEAVGAKKLDSGPQFKPGETKNKTTKEVAMQTLVTKSEQENILKNVTGDKVAASALLKDLTIDDITATRMRIYGLTRLDITQVNVIVALETYLKGYVTFNADGSSTLTKPANEVFDALGARFGVGIDPGALVMWHLWYAKRFLPAYLNFMAQTKHEAPELDPFRAWQYLKATQLLKIVDHMNAARGTNSDGELVSVWNFKMSPFPGEVSGTDSSIIEDTRRILKEAGDKAEMEVIKRNTAIKNGNTKTKAQNKIAALNANLLETMNRAGLKANETSSQIGVAGPGTSQENAGMQNIRTAPQKELQLSGDAKKYAEELLAYAQSNGITGEELALFMGQVSEETGDFVARVERGDSNYFKKYEQGALAKQLGNTQAGDGERFKGRGWMQITGRAAYEKYGQLLGLDLINNPELMADPRVANYTAVHFWKNYAIPLIKRKGLPVNTLTTSAAVNGWYKDPSNDPWPKKAINYDVRIEKIREWAQRLGLTDTNSLTNNQTQGETNGEQNGAPGTSLINSDDSTGGTGGNLNVATTPTPGDGQVAPAPTQPSSYSNNQGSTPSYPPQGGTPGPLPPIANPKETQVDRNYQQARGIMGTHDESTTIGMADSATVKWQGLTIKGRQAVAGGRSEPGIYRLAHEIEARVQDFDRFTAFNDLYHQKVKYNSAHKSGLGLDFTVKSQANGSIAAFREVLSIMRLAGMTEPNIIKHGGHWMASTEFTVINEYLRPTAASTAGHIHVSFNNTQAAAKFMKNMGNGVGQMGDEDDGFSKSPAANDPGPEVATTPSAPGLVENTPTPGNGNVLTPEQQVKVQTQQQIRTEQTAQQAAQDRNQAARAAASNANTRQYQVPESVTQYQTKMMENTTRIVELLEEMSKRDDNPATATSNGAGAEPPAKQSYSATQGGSGRLPVNLKVGNG